MDYKYFEHMGISAPTGSTENNRGIIMVNKSREMEQESALEHAG